MIVVLSGVMGDCGRTRLGYAKAEKKRRERESDIDALRLVDKVNIVEAGQNRFCPFLSAQGKSLFVRDKLDLLYTVPLCGSNIKDNNNEE